MKTKIIKLNTIEIKDDLIYDKYYKSEELSYNLREVPLDTDADSVINELRNNAISQSVDGAKIVSTSSKIVSNPNNFRIFEEITINYE